MILDQNAIHGECRVMMFILIDLHTVLLAQQRVGLLLTTIEPNINIATRTVFGRRVAKAQSVALQEHHLEPVAIVERGELPNGCLLLGVTLFDAVDIGHPAQQDVT